MVWRTPHLDPLMMVTIMMIIIIRITILIVNMKNYDQESNGVENPSSGFSHDGYNDDDNHNNYDTHRKHEKL